MIFCSTFGNIKTRWLRLTEVYRVIYLEQVKAKVFLCSLLTKVRNRSRIFMRVGHETTYLRILWKINNLFTKSCHYQTYQSWSNPCKILSGQLSKLAVLLDPKFEKRPTFFFQNSQTHRALWKQCSNNPSGNSPSWESAATLWKHEQI